MTNTTVKTTEYKRYKAIANLTSANQHLMAALSDLQGITNTLGEETRVVADAQTLLGELVNKLMLGEVARYLNEDTGWTEDPTAALNGDR